MTTLSEELKSNLEAVRDGAAVAWLTAAKLPFNDYVNSLKIQSPIIETTRFELPLDRIPAPPIAIGKPVNPDFYKNAASMHQEVMKWYRLQHEAYLDLTHQIEIVNDLIDPMIGEISTDLSASTGLVAGLVIALGAFFNLGAIGAAGAGLTNSITIGSAGKGFYDLAVYDYENGNVVEGAGKINVAIGNTISILSVAVELLSNGKIDAELLQAIGKTFERVGAGGSILEAFGGLQLNDFNIQQLLYGRSGKSIETYKDGLVSFQNALDIYSRVVQMAHKYHRDYVNYLEKRDTTASLVTEASQKNYDEIISAAQNIRDDREPYLEKPDTLLGDSEDNVLLGTPAADIIYGLEGSDAIVGRESDDTLDGGEGNDNLVGKEGNDWLLGGEGNNFLFGSSGDDTLQAGSGQDLLSGEEGDDWLIGGAGEDFLAGGIGNDTLQGGADSDLLGGEEGNDLLYGNEGNDSLFCGEGDDTAYGGKSDDWIAGREGADIVYGDLGNDILQGNAGNDFLAGGEGNDILYGGKDDDTLDGGNGNDLLYGDLGEDLIYGNSGDDTVLGGAGDSNDTLYGGDDNDVIYGGGGNDLEYGEAGNDLIYGNQEDDILDGGDGDDTLYGGKQNDDLHGQAGNDYLSGDLNDDSLWGGAGADTLYGGQGSDRFFLAKQHGGETIANSDLIADFRQGEDRIELLYGLTVADLNIYQGSDIYENYTILQDKLTGEYLARLYGIQASNLSRNDFHSETDDDVAKETDELPLTLPVIQLPALNTPPAVTPPAVIPPTNTNPPVEEEPIAEEPVPEEPIAEEPVLDEETSNPGIIEFTDSIYQINEDGTSVNAIKVKRTDGSDGAVTVKVALSDNTATSPDDYNLQFVTVTFEDGESGEKLAVIPTDKIVDDTEVEELESINLTLVIANGEATLGSRQTAILEIVDNEALNTPPTLVNNTVLKVDFARDGIVDNSVLQSTDAEQSPDQIIYTLTSSPKHGTLLLDGKPLFAETDDPKNTHRNVVGGYTFTQQDINNGSLVYVGGIIQLPSHADTDTVYDAVWWYRTSNSGSNILLPLDYGKNFYLINESKGFQLIGQSDYHFEGKYTIPDAAITDSYIVWTQKREKWSDFNYEMHLYDLNKNSSEIIFSNDVKWAELNLKIIDNSYIVWVEDYELYLYDINRQKHTKVADNIGYRDSTTGYPIRGQSTISGNHLIYTQCVDEGDYTSTSYNLFSYDINTGENTLLHQGADYYYTIAVSDDSDIYYFHVEGKISWYDINNNQIVKDIIPDTEYLDWWKPLDSRYVIWKEKEVAKIFIFDLNTMTTTEIDTPANYEVEVVRDDYVADSKSSLIWLATKATENSDPESASSPIVNYSVDTKVFVSNLDNGVTNEIGSHSVVSESDFDPNIDVQLTDSGRQLVYALFDGNDTELFHYDINRQVKTQITDNNVEDKITDVWRSSLSDLIIYTSSSSDDIKTCWVYDPITGVTNYLADINLSLIDENFIEVRNNKVVWWDWRTQDLYEYDRQTEVTTLLTDNQVFDGETSKAKSLNSMRPNPYGNQGIANDSLVLGTFLHNSYRDICFVADMNSSSDSFSFTVSDGAGEILPENTFNIDIL